MLKNVIRETIVVQIAAIRHSVEDVGDAERVEDLGAGGVVVASEEEEALEHLGGEGIVRRRGALPVRRLPPVAAHPADLPLLALVVVAADSARVLPLPLRHLVSFSPRGRRAARSPRVRGVTA